MPKLFLVSSVLIAFVVISQGYPAQESDISAAVAAQNWDEVHRLLREHARKTFNWAPPLSEDVRNLKPVPGGEVYGESEFTFHATSNLNGGINEQTGGHKIVNDNGKITEFKDLNTQTIFESPVPISADDKNPNDEGGQIFGESESTHTVKIWNINDQSNKDTTSTDHSRVTNDGEAGNNKQTNTKNDNKPSGDSKDSKDIKASSDTKALDNSKSANDSEATNFDIRIAN